jgi:23S rRNA (cytidine1920-2'-O)/16S rRNA (cytidine1409-2'-O)-methyltransferase
VIPAIAGVVADGADAVLLIKPQFEAGRREVGRGVITDPAIWRRAVEGVAQAASASGLGPIAVTPSLLPGPAGNVEFFLHARSGEAGATLPLDDVMIRAGAVRGRAS